MDALSIPFQPWHRLSQPLAFLKNLFILFIYFWLRWVFIAARGPPSVAVCGGYSLLRWVGFSSRWLLPLWSTGSRRMGFSSCGTRAQELWLVGIVAPRHVGSSWTRVQTRVPCIGRWIPNHCATREALPLAFLKSCTWSMNHCWRNLLYYADWCEEKLKDQSLGWAFKTTD